MTSNGTVEIRGRTYTTVAKRLEDLHKEKRLVSVETEVLQHTPSVVVKAKVNISGNIFTGISSVNPTSGKTIEKTNPYEVAETSAVGRALAFAGYAGSEFPSADEMAKAGVTDEQGEEPPMPLGEESQDVNVCPHPTFKLLQSHSEKNPGRWFKSCGTCKAFIGWSTPPQG